MKQTDLDLLVLRPLTCDDVAQISESICSINSVVSMVQTIEVAVHSIRQTLMSMEELVTKAVKRYFTSNEKIRMQQELQQLANHVNQIVNDTFIISRTDLSKNKLLSPEGRDIDTHIGYGDEIHIPACDMTFPIEQVDLTKNGRDALTIVKHALGNVNEFMNCLERRLKFLLEVISGLDTKVTAFQKIKMTEYDVSKSAEFGALVEALFTEYPEELYITQANLRRNEVLQTILD